LHNGYKPFFYKTMFQRKCFKVSDLQIFKFPDAQIVKIQKNIVLKYRRRIIKMFCAVPGQNGRF